MEQQYYNQFVADICQFIPKKNIYTDELRTLAWGTDASFYRLTPKVVVRAKDEQQVVKVIMACQRHHLPFTFRAAGTSLSGQSLSDAVLIVAGKSWEQYEVSPDHDSIRMQPGLVGGYVNQILKPFGRVLPPDPASVNSAMIGGIVSNNASGMNCGVHANSDRMLLSARIILPDGTLLDTGNKESREAFKQSHPEFLQRITSLRDRVRSNTKLSELIRYKYGIKNVTGLNIRPLVAYDDPFDIIAHSIVGSEGTLAFLSRVDMRTLHEYPFRASAMVYFHSMKESCYAIVEMKKLTSSDQDLAYSAENLMVKSAEMLDYLSLASVNDPVYLQYRKDVDAGLVPGVEPGDYHHLTAILTETKAVTHEDLLYRMETIKQTMSQYHLYKEPTFTEDPKLYNQYWAIRSGIFPSVGGRRPVGTTCLIEDVAFHLEDLPEATVELQALLAKYGYQDACIYGHAFEGNYHFIFSQSFNEEAEVNRYADMMKAVARMVVEKYHGSLKAEHGTGRNMAPFVKYEWGADAYEVMKELKGIFDPKGLLNPGVIFNEEPVSFIQHLKPSPPLSYDFDRLKSLSPRQSTEAMIELVHRADKCIGCGFCEVNCVSCGMTLSARMRIEVQRNICALEAQGTPESKAHAEQLRKAYQYEGDVTCATDGLCATSCPMNINTGDLTHLIRQFNMLDSPAGYRVGNFAAQHMAGIKKGLRMVLDVASFGHQVLGSKAMTGFTQGLHRVGVPLWTTSMPHAISQPVTPPQLSSNNREHDLKVVYFPSCINQTMGLAKGAPVKNSVVDEMCLLLQKAGYEVIFPPNMNSMCCGQIWESKGMMDIADRKTQELGDALWKASEEGRYPVLCDQSPCLHRMRKTITRMKLYEPVEFIMTYLRERLDFHPTNRQIAVHITCSTREMGLTDEMIALAHLCSNQVLIPDGVGCCAFAGDKGFTHPESNQWALRKLKSQIEANKVTFGYSNSRTCEIGLQTHSGIPYMSIAYLVNDCTTAK